MSKDLLKRAEAMLKDGYCNEDHETYEGCGTCEGDMASIIQELLDKLKGDAERLESADLKDEMGAAIRKGERNMYPLSCGSINGSKILAQAAINVIKGDDNA